MTLVTLRPTSTVVVSMVETGGSAYAVLADNSDLTYCEATAPGHTVVVEMDNPTLPAGAVVRDIRARIRQGLSGGILHHTWVRNSAGVSLLEQDFAGTTYIATLQTAPLSRNFTAAELNGLQWADFATAGGARVYEAYLDVTYVVKPTVTVIAPTGTVTDTNRPTIVWTRTYDSSGGNPTAYVVRVFTAAQYGIVGFDPATSPATDSVTEDGSAVLWQTRMTLADGNYRAYVWFAQTVNGALHWSDPNYGAFSVLVDLPGEPTVLLTPDAPGGRIVIELSDNAGAATTDGFQVERSVDGGVTWTAVRTTDSDEGIILGTSATVYDYEAPNGTLTTYRVRALHDYPGGGAGASAWETATALWESDDWWIKLPTTPSLNLNLGRGMFSYSSVTRAARQGVFQPVGATRPIVVSDKRGGPAGTIVVQLATVAMQDALDVLLDETATVLLQGPVTHGHPDRYVRIGDHGSERVVDKGLWHMTRETLVWSEVVAPAGVQTGEQYIPADPDSSEELVFL